jgi:beta-galactosidase
MKLGVCYYPEHWPEEWWADDAKRMRDMGISWVRIAEFAWSRIEPEPGRFDWSWLDRAIATLGTAGLKVVMCTPTATPPKWLVDRDPTVLALDWSGRPRKFGSRRHYCFSSETYRTESARITTAVAERYGNNDAVGAWQTDNEFGCHDTTLSYSDSAAKRFRQWLARRYNDIDSLNRAWGNVFWSMEYRSFEEIDPPNLTVTESNPSHRLDYRRFASDEVAGFNKIQTDIIRRLSPGRDVTHNFMAFHTDADAFEISKDLDFASWDNYPLGTLGQSWLPRETKARYLRQGHPDMAAFQHDLYRACGRGRWWVMEQQPGPVNWANYNPAPLPGMVRAWTWEAFAHGAEVVSYFRWRQVPFAQEQMHAGLNLPDRSEDVGGQEARQVARELAQLGELPPCARADVALVASFESDWFTEIQPQGREFRWIGIAFDMYSTLRGLGLDVDFVQPEADLSNYKLVVVPSLLAADENFVARLRSTKAVVLLGPRTGSKTRSLQIPSDLPPGPLASLIPLRVTRVESLAPAIRLEIEAAGQSFTSGMWREMVRTDLKPVARFVDGGGAWYKNDRFHYLTTWPHEKLWGWIMHEVAIDADLNPVALQEGVRTQRRGDVMFAINFAPEVRRAPAPAGADYVLGGPELLPAGVAAWRVPAK